MKVGDIYKWQGLKNSDTGLIEGGYLYAVTKVNADGSFAEGKGVYVKAGTRGQAIREYEAGRVVI